jgi:hypothetical protein
MCGGRSFFERDKDDGFLCVGDRMKVVASTDGEKKLKMGFREISVIVWREVSNVFLSVYCRCEGCRRTDSRGGRGAGNYGDDTLVAKCKQSGRAA